MTDFLVTFEHLHSVQGLSVGQGFCHRGARQFCQRYQLSWAQAVQQGGIYASQLEATQDALALRLVAHARKELYGQ
ncbi:hypothetical protein VQ643_04385 [Pseudomonas sp. F1_0610]|uniref:hypothetical protein n=1 Tax=Pseudomonas sp. F1_0610 TaxID=3114284 RepID=UPI0039C0C736